MSLHNLPDHARRYVEACEHMSEGTAEAFLALMSEDVVFADPFNRVRGKSAVRTVYDHMFRTLRDVGFRIRHAAMDDNVLLISWTFSASQAAVGPFRFEGCSEIVFDQSGLVSSHIDHWDSSREVIAKIPVLGLGFRGFLKLFEAR